VRWLIDLRKPFRQLEDFNSGPRDKDSEEYTKKYHEKMSAREGKGEIPPTEKLTYVGCYRKEDQLPSEKVYGGGVVGASASAAFNHARSQKKRYVAVARVGDDGHAFAFDSLPSGAAVNDGGCARPCADDDAFACGCADAGCDGVVKRSADEEYVRRWAVYDVGAPKKRRKKRSEL
jgi:dolichyl-diphosphooligosaccharide--protein glycosyltransferase